MTTTQLRTTYKRGSDLEPGDALEFLGKTYRITHFEPYNGVHDFIARIACVEGRGAFMSIDHSHSHSYRVAS